MSWVRYAALVFPVIFGVSSCNPPKAEQGRDKKTGAVTKATVDGGGSIITGNSGSFKITVGTKDSTTYTWTCNTSMDDCYTTPPLGSNLAVYASNTLVFPTGGASGAMNSYWNIEINPHFVQLESIGGVLHAYANGFDGNGNPDKWKMNSATEIEHSNGNKIKRIVITDSVNGRTFEDAASICPGGIAQCKISFTIQ